MLYFYLGTNGIIIGMDFGKERLADRVSLICRINLGSPLKYRGYPSGNAAEWFDIYILYISLYQ